jgi:tetratricopeptide (TPR) repeat protein
MSQKKNIPPKKAAGKPLPLSPKPVINTYIYLGIAVLATLICFSNAFKNDFTNWDDVSYVTENNLVKSLSWANIKDIFSNLSVMGNYHPLAIVSLAIDYHFNKLNAQGFHTTSIIIHLLNVALVFFFVQLLTKKPLIAFITALLFGIHPMHVESVAWVAERKDVLYVFFYMASLIAYVKYIKSPTKNIVLVCLSFLLFGFSLLSKAQAVTLPVVLLLIDYFAGRKIEMKAILEKIPFFLLALVMGYIAVLAQKKTGAIQDIPKNPLFERILYASHSLLNYGWKLIYPGSLSAYYPYPTAPSLIYYIAPFVAIGLVVLVIKYYKNRALVLGTGFFIVNIFLLLQLLPVGGAMMAERYSYLCSIGLFFIASKSVVDLLENKKYDSYKYIIMAAMVGYGGYLANATYQRNKIWKNSEVLWKDVIRQHKDVPIAYNDLGSYFQKHEQLDSALVNFNEAIRLQSSFPEALVNRSDIFRVKGNYTQAIADCDSALAADKNYTQAHMNRGIAYCHVNKYDEALKDFSYVASKNSSDPSLYRNRGNLYDMSGKLDSAISDYSMAIQLDPESADAYFSRARSYVKMKKYKEALADLTVFDQINPDNKDLYIYRVQVYKEMGNYTAALQDAMTAKKLGVQVNEDYISDLKAHIGAQSK